jgi:chromosomal replication initiation ATPase DnaA
MLKNTLLDGSTPRDEKEAAAASPRAQSQNSASPITTSKLPDPAQDVTWRIVEHAVMKAFSVGVGDINTGSWGAARAAHARQVAMYLAHVACHHSYTEVGRMVNRDRTTVAHACAVVEDGRDDPVFDQTLDNLERSVMLMASRQTPSPGN